MGRTILCIVLLVIALACIIYLVVLIRKLRKIDEERAILYYLIETEMENDDDSD